MAIVLQRKLTRREFRERMSSGELKACIIPVGSIEQHLEHMALEHDWRSVLEVSVRVAEKLSPGVLVAEGLMAGISEHHMRHPGTFSLRPATFLAVLTDLVESTVRAGFKNILVLNGHGGNVSATEAIWDQLLRLYPVNLQFLSYWDVLTKEDARELLAGGNRIPEDLPGHAQEFETAIGLAAFPENVRLESINQPDPAPGLANAERGREILNRVVNRVADYVVEMIAGKRAATIPRFYE